MSPAELAELAQAALRAAEEAAAVVRAGFRSRPRAEEKGARDLVTEFDRASEDLLLARLNELTPGVPAVGEEHAGANAASRPTGSGTGPGRRGLVWYVDPLDGTTNFVHGHPFWSIAVGLMDDDVPVAGAVVAPELGLRWTGWSTNGAGTAGSAGEARRNGERCAVSATVALGQAMVGTGFPPLRDEAPANNFDAFMAVKRRAQAVRRCGSAAIDLCLVGDGTYDGFWERRLHAWDVVAGSAIVLAAGGSITALDGGPPNYHVGHIVASNGRIHGELVRLVSGNGEAAVDDARVAELR